MRRGILFIWFAFFSLYADPLLPVVQEDIGKQCVLTPPKGWDTIDDPDQLPKKIKLACIGKSKHSFTPSINIAVEETSSSLENYMREAKLYHEAQKNTQCSALGKLATHAGQAELLQIDTMTQWGRVRFIQAIMIKEKIAYVITATCLFDEFSSLSSPIFKSIQTFNFVEPLREKN